MKNIQNIETLREQLIAFEQDVTTAIQLELLRINRVVRMDEFNFIPFSEQVRDYIDAIRLDDNNSPLLETSFQDTAEKPLSAFISDNEIDHWDLIALLELLQNIEGNQHIEPMV